MTKGLKRHDQRSSRAPAWPDLVARNLAPALLALGLGLGSPALAQTSATPRPAFTAEQLHLVARNASLAAVLPREPWLVHRVLQEVAKAQASRDNRAGPAEPSRRGRKDRFDRKRDPDLNGMERVAPEAAYDLFLLLKKVRKDDKAEPAPKPAPAPAQR